MSWSPTFLARRSPRIKPLIELLAENPEISKHLDRAALAKLLDPANYLGLSREMVDRVLQNVDSRK